MEFYFYYAKTTKTTAKTLLVFQLQWYLRERHAYIVKHYVISEELLEKNILTQYVNMLQAC